MRGLLLLLGACAGALDCPSTADVPLDRGTTTDRLDAAAADAAVRRALEGTCVPALSVAVVDADGLRYAAGAGWADVDAGVAVTSDSPFLLASVSKMVLGLALVEAQADGALDLDDPVQDHLPFRLADPREGGPVRLSHLATHSSGILDDWDVLDEQYVDGDPTDSLEGFLAAHLSEGGRWYRPKRSFARWGPGEGVEYSNVGASLAALAVQGAVGQDYAEWTGDRILEPAGMDHSGWFLADLPDDAPVAAPTTVTAGGEWKVHDHYGWPTYPDGQLRAPAGDVAELLRLVLTDGDGVLAPGAVDALLAEPHPELRAQNRADGVQAQRVSWFDIDWRGRRLTGHDGSEFGTTTSAFVDRETGVGVVILTNVGDGAGDGRAGDALARLERTLWDLADARP
jgi:CubicO group peptidase (beta-lactamase class C family)